MGKASGRVGAVRNGVDPGDGLHAREQVDEKIARQTLAIIGKTAPAEEALGLKRPLRRVLQERIPIDGLGAGVMRDRVNPGAGGRVAVRISLNVMHFTETSRLINLRGLGVQNRAHTLAAALENALTGAYSLHHGQPVSHVV